MRQDQALLLFRLNPRRRKHFAPRDDFLAHEFIECLRRAGLGGGALIQNLVADIGGFEDARHLLVEFHDHCARRF